MLNRENSAGVACPPLANPPLAKFRPSPIRPAHDFLCVLAFDCRFSVSEERAEEAAAELPEARAAAAAAGESVPQHCWCSGTLDGNKWNYDQLDAGGLVRRWCATCHHAAAANIFQPAIDLSQPATRPAAVAGACEAGGCPGCVGPLPERARIARQMVQTRKQQKEKNFSWGRRARRPGGHQNWRSALLASATPSPALPHPSPHATCSLACLSVRC